MEKDKKIKAMKNGMVGLFTEQSWRLSNPEKYGWQRVGEGSEAEKIESEEIVKEKIKVVSVEEPIKEEHVREEIKKVDIDDKEPTVEEMRAYLNGLAKKGKIKKPHHALGKEKLKALYDENTK